MAKGKRKIATKLEKVFGEPFIKLIGKNFKRGDSRYKVQVGLLKMIVERGLVSKATETFTKKDGNEIIKTTEGKWDPDKWKYDKFGAVSVESNPAFRPSVLYHAIKDARESGELDTFDFFIGNKGRKTNSNREYSKINVELVCRKCGVRHKNNGMNNSSELGLRVYPCPKCGAFGKCTAKIIENGKTFYKAVVKFNGIRQETKVVSENDLTPVDNTQSPSYREKETSTVNV